MPIEDAFNVRAVADQVFSRAAGAPLVRGNAVRLLRDAVDNYPAWLDAIQDAQRTIYFENYIFRDDEVGRRFAAALAQRARAGVCVRVVYDWLGNLYTTRARFWQELRDAGAEVRCYNPLRLDEPFGWVRRDHRKCLVVDEDVAFVTGLCVGQAWEGFPDRGIAAWRDTGLEIRGPAVVDVADAFADTWSAIGAPLPPDERAAPALRHAEGDVDLRVVATVPGTANLYHLDPLVASLARRTLWLTDAYFAGTSSYIQALRAAARDGVDVRLLVPGAGSDVPFVQSVSRAGYRVLLEAGIRVFEWNGPMLHAKTAVADARWARVGSTNLNLASWIGNRELDVVVENERFGRLMEEMFESDLENATEIVLGRRSRIAPTARQPRTERRGRGRGARGSATRATAGAIRIGNALGSALTARRVLGAAENRLMAEGAIALLVLAVLASFWPRVVAWPLAAISLWLASALLARTVRRRTTATDAPDPARREPAAIPAEREAALK